MISGISVLEAVFRDRYNATPGENSPGVDKNEKGYFQKNI